MKKTIALLCLLALSYGASAQQYPDRPIHLVVPFGPGGFTDVAARILQKELQPVLGQPIVVENKAGAGSTIGTDYVAKAPPDGYNLVMVSTTHVISPHLYKDIPYDPVKDFAPVMKLAEGPYVLVVNSKTPYNSVKDLIAAAKANPGSIDFASSGNGSSQHLVAALFMNMTGAKLNHIPYKGSNQAMQDVIGGQVPVSFVGLPNALPNVSSGKIRALAVTTKKRHPDLPNVPTMEEAGVPGYDATIWLALLAPKGTPADVVQKINAAVTQVLSRPDARKLMNSAGVNVATSSPEELEKLLVSELDRWGKVVKETGAVVN
ncbi:MAG TPA: tripartite tricarboxylate transporter substrate binding protein [Usitatibacter sp.]|jgi:tripartite-type tricarboxylate transporter receptor subunit TctC|nr:tripartite tricarboxylate transporter substrate binding protein [Usitatibacter sp.]